MPRLKRQAGTDPNPATSEPTVILKVSLPKSVHDSYEQFASLIGVPLEDVLADRLQSCVDHNAGRGVYFNDPEREELENLAGRRPLRTAEDALEALRALQTLELAKAVPITFSAGQLRRLNMGRRVGQSLADHVSTLFLREVRRVAGV